MAFIEIFKNLSKNKQFFSHVSRLNKTKMLGINPFLLIGFIFFFIVDLSYIQKKQFVQCQVEKKHLFYKVFLSLQRNIRLD